MRNIGPKEPTLGATQISARFLAEYGVDLHPTNVGAIAKRLGLDYVEVPFDDEVLFSDPSPWLSTPKVKDRGRWQSWAKLREYGEEDLPRIFAEMRKLAISRGELRG